MACHESKACPRCAQPFECKPGSITECQCYGIAFSEAEKDHIGAAFQDCLCRACLLALKQDYKQTLNEQKLARIRALLKYQ